MNKVFANIDYIVGVKLYYEELTDYEFHPEIQDEIKTYFWGLYEKIVKFGKPARWIKKNKGDFSYNWFTDIDVREWTKSYRVQELPKMLFKRPYVEIRYVNNDSSYVYFTTDEELDNYVDTLKNKMGGKLSFIVESN